MSDTTENEIFSVLVESLRSAAEDCAKLAWDAKRGWIYNRFRASLKQIEGACRQLYYWRNYDARWLALGRLAPFVHQRSGAWLRGPLVAGPNGELTYGGGSAAHRKRAQPEFLWLSQRLLFMLKEVERCRTLATGRAGPILPVPREAPHRDTRPVQVATPAGLLLPPGFKDRRAA